MKQLIAALKHPQAYPWWTLRPWRRHSLVLFLSGSICIGIGLIYAITESTPTRTAALELALRWLPMQAWGTVFVAVGLTAIAGTRWPPASEKWSYTVLSAFAALWGSCFVLGVLLLGAPTSGLAGGGIWWLLAFLWWAISGLDNPHDRVKDE